METLAPLPEMNRAWFRTQADVFKSGLFREIGPNAFSVWSLIKSHADFNTGEAWPGMRHLKEVTGMGTDTLRNAIHALVNAHMLRIEEPGKGTRASRYVAQERLDVWIGSRRICIVAVDYVPARIGEQLRQIDAALKGAAAPQDTFSNCRVIPGDGFRWDADTRTLQADIPTRELVDNSVDKLGTSC